MIYTLLCLLISAPLSFDTFCFARHTQNLLIHKISSKFIPAYGRTQPLAEIRLCFKEKIGTMSSHFKLFILELHVLTPCPLKLDTKDGLHFNTENAFICFKAICQSIHHL